MIIINELYDENEIKNCINKSKPINAEIFSVTSILRHSGWVYIHLKNAKKEFQIKFSEVMTNPFDLINFLYKIINLENDITLFIDYEGYNPFLYAKKIGANEIRFLFAQDYDVYFDNCEDSIDEYKIDCDIIIEKKALLKNFYDILLQYTNNCAETQYTTDIFFFIDKAKIYLDKIKDYIK